MILLLAAAAAAAPPALDSAYTPLDLDSCILLEEAEEGESRRWRCPGRGDIPVFVSTGDGRFDVDAGSGEGEWESIEPFNDIGPRVEWRLRSGVPFAIIFRLSSADPDHPGGALFVETIGGAGAAPCLVARIDAGRRNANAFARAVADRRAAGFRCGVDSPERH